MQFLKNFPMTKVCKRSGLVGVVCCLSFFYSNTYAQVSNVEFGKNRVQYKKFKWTYYQSDNFNTYFSQLGEPIAKYVAQVAEKELAELEAFCEYGLQRRANIVVYNHFNEMEQSNIGLSLDWQTSGGTTKLVNNKIIVYYNGDHQNLRKQVREGIARILTDNVLFGDDLGEFAANQALLDLPQWLIDGYVEYAAQNWSTELDDMLKSAILGGTYKNFYQFAFDKPLLAGHSFWYYISERYKKENVTYFLYLARVYRNVNSASNRIAKKKFKEVLRDFMEYQETKYTQDIRSRRNAPRGSVMVVEEVTKTKDFFRFTPNPAPRSQTYAVVEYKRGVMCVKLYEDYNGKVLLKSGYRSNSNTPNPNYPQLAWDPKGNRLAVIYWKEGKIQLFVYDLLTKRKSIKQELVGFEQVQDFKFMLDNNTLLFSAVKNGQSDIFTYKIDKEQLDQITNDVYDDLDATFVAFPSKTGIIYASNRPSVGAPSSDTILPSDNRYNIFLIDNWNRSEFKQISQLSRMRYGNARYPSQYNTSHFTFVSDENGIANRYAGFFQTRRAGVDTIYTVGEDFLRNPEPRDLDSLLRAYNKSEPDSMYAISLTSDSAYVFPITNYESSLKETKIAGENGMVSEVRQEGELLFLYKLRVDDNALRKRNVNARPTQYRKKLVDEARIAGREQPILPQAADTTQKAKDLFESEFDSEAKKDAPAKVFEGKEETPAELSLIRKAKRFDYKLKFSVDQLTGSLFNNDVLITRYEPYTGSLPITLNNSGALNGMLKATVFDIMEDIRFTGMMRSPLINTAGTSGVYVSNVDNPFIPSSSSLFNSGSEFLARFDYLKRRLDYSAIYYRKTEVGATQSGIPMKLYTNLWQAVVKYPLDKIRSIRITGGVRTDKFVTKAIPEPNTLATPDIKKTYGLGRIEYVHDDVVQKATNIMNGLRYKVFVDYNAQISKVSTEDGRNTYNFGVDARYYYPIFRNFIWAGRAAADFSWGNQKILYYLGGTDGWLLPKANKAYMPQDPDYAFQSLAVNMRGFNQNVSNGNNAMVINSEFRLPLLPTILNKPINNAFLRNFQLIQFIDLGTAWNGAYNKMSRPTTIYQDDPPTPVSVRFKAGGIGPFVGGYGFGARSTLLGYFLRLDAGWDMSGFFRGKPILYFSMGMDF